MALWQEPIKRLFGGMNECVVGSTMTVPQKSAKCRVWCSKGSGKGGHYKKGTADLTLKFVCKSSDYSLPGRGYWSGEPAEVVRPCDAECGNCYSKGSVEYW